MTKQPAEMPPERGWTRRSVLGVLGASLMVPGAAAETAPPDGAARAKRAAAAAAAFSWPETDEHGDRLAPPGARFSPFTVPRPMPGLKLTPLQVGGQVPDFAGGKGVLLHFWAPWCAPCIRELPLIVAGSKAEDLALAAVSTDTRTLFVRFFCYRLQIPQAPVFIQNKVDDDGDLLLGGVLPTTLIVDPSGQIRARAIGEVDWRLKDNWDAVLKWCR